jgi:hypothetical protein
LTVYFCAPFPLFLRLHSKRDCIFSGGFGVVFCSFLRPFFRHAERDDFVFAPLLRFSRLHSKLVVFLVVVLELFSFSFGVVLCSFFAPLLHFIFLVFRGGWVVVFYPFNIP